MEQLILMNMKFYDATSKGYNELHGDEQKNKVEIIKKNISFNKKELILDVGCGTGISSEFECKVIGLDPSIRLLKQNKCRKVMAKAENIPFKTNSFDKVVSITAIHNFDDIKKSFEEMERVGKHDFVFSVLKKSKHFNEIESEIKKKFMVKKILDGKLDWIFICNLAKF